MLNEDGRIDVQVHISAFMLPLGAHACSTEIRTLLHHSSRGVNVSGAYWCEGERGRRTSIRGELRAKSCPRSRTSQKPLCSSTDATVTERMQNDWEWLGPAACSTRDWEAHLHHRPCRKMKRRTVRKTGLLQLWPGYQTPTPGAHLSDWPLITAMSR